MILGLNGYVWVSKEDDHDDDTELTADLLYSDRNNVRTCVGFCCSWSLLLRVVCDAQEIVDSDRMAIARVGACIRALGCSFKRINESSITHAYNLSMQYPVKDLLNDDVRERIASVSS